MKTFSAGGPRRSKAESGRGPIRTPSRGISTTRIMAPPGEMGTPARNSITQSIHQNEDEYDLEALGGAVADGCRFQAQQQPELLHVELPPSRRQSSIQSQYTSNNPPPRPSSVSKPKYSADNFALRNDGSMGPTSTPSSTPSSTQPGKTSILSRASSVSTVSTQSTARPAGGPYQGPSGPSFAYQMYPQATRLARTMSVATTSTAAIPERPYEGPAGPTHPYGMYPQSVTPDAQENLPVAAIPVGFPGLNNEYQRRIGPEGEEAADIIGPDGHTEQLPPYTQYPDEALARKALAALGTGAGGLGLATRNPEYDSPRDEAAQSPLSPNDRASVVSRGSGISQQTQSAMSATAPITEKEELKHWQIVAKRKVCGIIPIWGFGLMAATILVMVAILAGVLTALKPKHRDRGMPGGPSASPQPNTYGSTIIYQTVTTTFDAKSTTLPSAFPILPTGAYQVNLGSPQDTQNLCIKNSAQLSTWSCAAPPLPISINITSSETTGEHSAILLPGQNVYSYNYGTQVPVISIAKKLDLVIDVNNPSYGPAWFFQSPYNKLVVLHQGQLSVSTSPTGDREVSFDPSSKYLNRRSPAQPGDSPWFCYWNGTLLETFIFPNQTSAAGAQQAGVAATTGSTPSTTGTHALPTAEQRRQPSSGHSSQPASISGEPSYLSGYPKIVKIEERRIPEGDLTVPPYCVSMTILDDGSPIPNLNSTTGMPIQIDLNETDPSLAEMSQKRGYTEMPRRIPDIATRDISSDCSCVWMAT